MGVLQDAVDKAIAHIPRLAIEKIITDKLTAAGVDDPVVAKRIATAVIEGAGDCIEFECDQQLDLAIGEEDIERIKRAAELFTEGLPDFIRTMTEDLAGKLADGFVEQWKAYPPSDDGAAIRTKIAADWGEPLDRLHMLVALCEQEGDKFNIAHLSGKSGRGQLRAEALARLHIRACRIAKEIILLLENGFAEGAQARWRTLHEVAVTATLIAEGGDTLAERHFEHEAALEQPVHRWDPTMHIPGAFAAGFEEPGSDTAQAIVQITGLLRAEPWDVDNVVLGLAMIRLRNDTARAWHEVAGRIAKREQRALDCATRRPGPHRRFGYVKAKPGPRRV